MFNVELVEGASQVVPEGEQLVALKIPRDGASGTLELSGDVTSVQLTGSHVVHALTLKGASDVELLSGETRQIQELHLVGSSATVNGQLKIADVQLDGTSALGWLGDSGGCERLRSSEAISFWLDVGPSGLRTVAGARPEGPNGPVTPHAVSVRVEELVTPRVTLAPDVTVRLRRYEPPAGATIECASRSSLVLVPGAQVGPVVIDGSEAEVELGDSAVLTEVSGCIGRLHSDGSCVVRGKAVSVQRLRCGAGADVGGVSLGDLDVASLAYAASMASFDVCLPEDRSWSSFAKSRASRPADPWQRSSTWRALHAVLDDLGSPASADWARKMEAEARRVESPVLSTRRAVLELARMLGHGHSVLRPLLVQLVVVVVALCVILRANAFPQSFEARDLYLLVPRLYLAPLALVDSDAFKPDQAPSAFDTAAWLACAITGTACFASAALGVRRLLRDA